MRIRSYVTCMLVFAVLVALLAGQAKASVAAFLTIDELGNGNINGTPINYSMDLDPGPGGLTTLCYHTGITWWTQGDLLLTEPGGGDSDLIRFGANGNLYFYSEADPGESGDLADVGLPTAFNSNFITREETYGSEGYNWYDHSPVWGSPLCEPGYGAYYHIISDVPEPTTLTLLCGAILGIGGVAMLRRKK
jgi:hypothetical protein